MNDSSATASSLLGEDSPLTLYLAGFKTRPGQQQMAAVVEQAIADGESVAIEVAAGAGKTLAYLVAAMVAGKKTIISTASHQLQQQLQDRDIPLVQRALGSTKKVALLMGRNNYLCPYYLNKHQQEEPVGKSLKARLVKIAAQYSQTGQGELKHYSIQDPQLKFALTATAEECLGKQCPNYLRCPWVQACQQFSEADIGVVNHSLLLTEKFSELAGDEGLFSHADTIIVDEAHRLTDFSRQLAPGINSWQLAQFFRDADAAIRADAPEQAQLLDYISRFKALIEQLKNSTWPEQDHPLLEPAAILESLQSWWQPLSTSLGRFAQRSTGLNQLSIRAGLVAATLAQIEQAQGLCWFEPRDRGFVLQSVPLAVSTLLEKVFARSRASWIFTSATLTVSGSPERFLSRIGQSHIPFHRIDSNIDYSANALLYMPAMGIEPNEPGYHERLLAQLLPVLRQAPGRSLLLFTSYRALGVLSGLMETLGEFDHFTQGEIENEQLLSQFKQSPRGVLLATGSFWEGLDLADTPLACVCIDRLPFASPADPLLKFRSDALRRAGVDAFQQEQLVDAVIRLRQGCGRLLRRREDRGVIILPDPRLQSRHYGDCFIDSLPPMQQTNSIDVVTEFFQSETVLP